MITLGTACSGIESASVALEPLGFKSQWFCEIEPFPSAVLAHHWPDVPNLNDMMQLPSLIRSGLVNAPDVFVAGTPCQSFSVAGKRLSLNDARGNLALTYVDVINAIDEQRPGDECVAMWENVPGVLSTKDNAFGTFLAALVGDCDEADRPVPLEAQPGAARQKWPKSGYVVGPQRTVAWRTLDAQYFGVAQRRRRVFVVASARDGFDPGKVLFESEGVRRDSAPSREAREEVACQTADCLRGCGVGSERVGDSRGADPVVAQPFKAANTLTARMHKGINSTVDEGQTPVVHENQRAEIRLNDVHGSLNTQGGKPAVLGVTIHGTDKTARAASYTDLCGSLRTKPPGSIENSSTTGILADRVRRLTPVECERLQGFQDGHTDVSYRGKPAADGPRYKAIGNSKAVPVVRFIGNRIKQELNK